MATAILDLDFDQLPTEISGLERYSRALVLIRLQGRPVGQALLPVCGGRIGDTELRESLIYAADSAFWEQWFHNYLGLRERKSSNIQAPLATVAVCTRDRPEDLKRCLNALMRLPDDGQELMVIDSSPSTDETSRIVGGYKKVRYVLEERPGLDIARNRALREAQHEIIAFTDDDASPDPDWLRALLRNFDDPLVICVTGLTMPTELETKAQECFQRLGGLGRGFKRYVFNGVRNDPLKGWHAGAGVNMALRRSILTCVGYFDEGLDVGSPIPGGGDTDMFRRILAAGYRIIYEPEALNWHRHRTEWKALRRQLYSYEMAGLAVWTRSLLSDRELKALKLSWDWFWRELANLGRSLLCRPECIPLDLMLARILGGFLGPWAYLYSRWHLWVNRGKQN